MFISFAGILANAKNVDWKFQGVTFNLKMSCSRLWNKPWCIFVYW